MPVLIHSARRGQNPAVIFPSALLVEGSAPKPLWTQNFILRLRVLQTLFVPYALFWGHGVSLCLSLRLLLQICPIG